MTKFIRLKVLIGGAATVLALGLGGCGSDDDDDVGAGPDREEGAAVPPGAGASVQAFHQFQKDLKRSDDSEPLITAGFVPPLSDSEDPLAIN